MTINEIEVMLSGVKKGTGLYYSHIDAFVLNNDENVGFGIVVNDDININESFNLIAIKTEDINIGGTPRHLLVLYTKDNSTPYNFSYICEDFLKTENRNLLLKNLVSENRERTLKNIGKIMNYFFIIRI